MAILPGSPNNSLGLRRGKQPNSVRDAFRLKGAIEKAAQRATMRRVWVRKYHHSTQTVDVVPVDDPATVVYGVPIRSGPIRTVTPLVGYTQNKPADDTDVGLLVYSDVENEYLLRGVDRPKSRHVNAHGRPIAPEFWPGDIDAQPALSSLVAEQAVLDEVGPDDAAFLFAGMGIVFRRDRGDGKSQIVVFADDIVFMRPGQDAAAISPVARQGDDGDGMGGTIAGGSSVTRSG